MKIVAGALLFSLCLLAVPGPVDAQEVIDSWQVKNLAGEIVELNTSKMALTVRWLQDPEDAIWDERVFQASKGVKILKGSDRIDFDDLNVGDHVMVRYYDDKFGSTKVLDLAIKI